MKKQKPVYATAGSLQAAMVVAFLKSKGIDAYSSQEGLGTAFGLQGTMLGKAKLYVLEEQREEALRLLAAMDAGEFELPDDIDLTDFYEDEGELEIDGTFDEEEDDDDEDDDEEAEEEEY